MFSMVMELDLGVDESLSCLVVFFTAISDIILVNSSEDQKPDHWIHGIKRSLRGLCSLYRVGHLQPIIAS